MVLLMFTERNDWQSADGRHCAAAAAIARAGRPPSPAGETGAAVQGVWVLGPQDPLADRQQRREQVPRGRRIPACPVQPARWQRVVRTCGCSAPAILSRTGTSAAHRSGIRCLTACALFRVSGGGDAPASGR
jgi:hypothetical protein